ncbi:hypothetical protein [Marinilabilia sp.]
MVSIRNVQGSLRYRGVFERKCVDLNVIIGQIMSVAGAAQTRKENQQSVDPDQN